MPLLLNVWRMRPPNPGHVSLEIDGVYISYWPADPAGKKDVKVGQTHAAAFPSSYRIDRRIEQRECDVRRSLVGLNTRQMIEAWTAFRENPARYNMVKHNCSTVIATLLEIGSRVAPAFLPRVPIDEHATGWSQRLFLRLRFLSSSIEMWTPDGILQYADQIEREIRFR